MKVFVAGGAGYIGSVTSERLLAAGHAVAVFDNLGHGHREAVPADAEFVEGDLRDLEAIRAAVARHRPDAVLHFAGDIQVGESMREPFLYLADNVACGLNLFRAALESGVRRAVFSSKTDKEAWTPFKEPEEELRNFSWPIELLKVVTYRESNPAATNTLKQVHQEKCHARTRGPRWSASHWALRTSFMA